MTTVRMLMRGKIPVLAIALLFVTSQVAWAARTSVTLTVVIESGSVSINVSTGNLTFNNGNPISPTTQRSRYNTTGPVNVQYSVLSPTNLTVFTENGNGKTGLRGVSDNTKFLDFRVWTSNFGPENPTVIPPDPNDNANWGNAGFWAFVREKTDTAGPVALLSGVSSPGNEDVWFAVDTVSVPKQQYQGSVFFEVLGQ
jgi:hypothetical protein